MNKLERLFSPRGIAVIGATEDETRPGGQAVSALTSYGYRGGVYPVNPKYRELRGLTCYASLSAIERVVDIAVIALPAAAAVGMVKTCGERGIPYAVVLGGGFREVGPEGIRRQAEMLEHARAHGVRILGPNCLGISNIHERVFAAFGSLARPPLHKPGPVSMVMQSGGFGNSIGFRCADAGIGFRLMIASGNEADLTAPELIEALIDDPATEIILAYLEGVADGRALMAAATRALAAGKPILIWKAGKSRQGIRAAATHTANMTGEYDVWRAAFRQTGIIEIRDTEQAADYIKVLLTRRLPRGRNVAIVSPSGGSAVAFSDSADEYGLTLVKPGEETAAAIREAMPNAVSLDNPIDLAANAISERNRPAFQRLIQALLNDLDVHQLGVMFPTLLDPSMHAGASVLAAAASVSNKPILVFSAMPHDTVPEAMSVLAHADIPVLLSPTRLARAAGLLADYAAQRERAGALGGAAAPAMALELPRFSGTLNEAQSKAFLKAAGIATTHDVVLPTDMDAFSSGEIRFPVAVKVLSAQIAHKTDIGGVVLNIRDAEGLRAAAAAVVASARQAYPAARLDGVLASEMIDDAIEVIVGVVNDSVFGPVVLLGIGGILAEAINDVTYRVAPFDHSEARSMIGELRATRIFDGLRGKAASDVDALARALVSVSRLAWQERERIVELDINPLMVRPKGHGTIAADALVVLREPGDSCE